MDAKRIGDYTIVRELGSGSMGTVYEALDPDGRRVALKLVHPQLIAEEGFRERLVREAEVGRKIVHPNVVRTLGAGEVDGRPFIVLEFVVGEELGALRREMGRVPETLCRHIGQMAARGLAAIHEQGVVHRDIKPENILITPDQEIRLMDLGFARSAAGLDRMTATEQFVGSPVYAPPEKFAGEGTLDTRSDLYSLGVTLFELSTGTLPFEAPSLAKLAAKIMRAPPPQPRSLCPEMSPFFEHVLLGLLEKDPQRRCASATELADVLETGEVTGSWCAEAAQLSLYAGSRQKQIRVPRDADCVGREEDLASLRAAFESAKAGTGRVLLLEGEAGIGKTRLMDEFFRRLHVADEDANVLYGSYPPAGAAVAAGAFASAYHEHLGEAGSGRFLEETPLLVPAFDALLRGDTHPEGVQPLSSDSMKTVFVHATRALARQRTTVVVIDDLHFAPVEGRALFASLAMAVPGHRVLLIGTTRPGLSAAWRAEMERVDHVVWRGVRRLGGEHIRGILAPVIGTSIHAAQLASAIEEKSGGNPFFLFEIVRSLREAGAVTQIEGGGWTTASRVAGFDLPESVRGILDTRIAQLSNEERELLEGAACWGVEFDGRVVAEALGMRRLPALRALGTLERDHRLVRAVGARFAFDHHAIQEHVYEHLPEALLEELHAALAEVLESTTGAADAEVETLDRALCVDICEHYVRGGSGRRALRYLPIAQAQLIDCYLSERAVELSERVLSQPGVLVGKARAEELLRGSLPLELLGRVEQRESHMREALRIADEQDDDVLRMQAQNAIGNALTSARRFEESAEAYRQSLEIATRIDNQRGIVGATGNLGNAYYCLGQAAEAREHWERSLVASRKIGFQRAEIFAGNIGLLDYVDGNFVAARANFETHLKASLEMGDRPGEPMCMLNLAGIDRDEGDLDGCERHLLEALAISEEIGFRRLTAEVRLALGSLRSAMSGGQRGARSLEAARDLAIELRLSSTYVIALCELSVIRPDGADAAKRAVAEQSASLDGGGKRRAHFLLWQATGDRSHLEESKRLLDEAVEQASPEVRLTMCENVRMNRDITRAWEGSGPPSRAPRADDPSTPPRTRRGHTGTSTS